MKLYFDLHVCPHQNQSFLLCFDQLAPLKKAKSREDWKSLKFVFLGLFAFLHSEVIFLFLVLVIFPNAYFLTSWFCKHSWVCKEVTLSLIESVLVPLKMQWRMPPKARGLGERALCSETHLPRPGVFLFITSACHRMGSWSRVSHCHWLEEACIILPLITQGTAETRLEALK